MNWVDLIECLPPGLTYAEAAKRLGKPWQTTRRAILKYGYRAADGRKFGQRSKRRIDPAKINWKLPNVAIALKFGVSRERVRVLRGQMGKPLVESRGRKSVK